MKTYGTILLMTLFAACFLRLAPQRNSSTQDWQTIEVKELFTFRLPPGFTTRPLGARQEERAEYYKGETKLLYVWGHTESVGYGERRQAWMNDYQESTTRIGGRRANIRTYSQTVSGKRLYRAELNVGNWEKGEVQLYMGIESSDPAVLDTAREIFKSVRFPLPPPERH